MSRKWNPSTLLYSRPPIAAINVQHQQRAYSRVGLHQPTIGVKFFPLEGLPRGTQKQQPTCSKLQMHTASLILPTTVIPYHIFNPACFYLCPILDHLVQTLFSYETMVQGVLKSFFYDKFNLFDGNIDPNNNILHL